MRPSYRPHYASCPSVCLSVPYGLVTRKQKRRKIKIDINVLRARIKWSTDFQLKRSKVKVTGRQKTSRKPHIWRTFYGRRIKRRRLRCWLQTRPARLLDLIYSQRLRRSATGRTAAYHVVTRRRHILLLFLLSFGHWSVKERRKWRCYLLNADETESFITFSKHSDINAIFNTAETNTDVCRNTVT